MNIKELLANKPKAMQSALMPSILSKWDSSIVARDSDNTIGIYDVIGDDYWGEGVTAKRISAALRAIGDKPVTVTINSPGGDVFEGIAIYNLLKEHSQAVTVKIVGIAASAASIIAMAGDEIEIGKSAFIMIHNAWTMAVGNRHDMREVASFLEPFDDAMVGVYSDYTGIKKDEIISMMDKETFIAGEAAVELGFATRLLDSDNVEHDDSSRALRADKLLDTLMAKAGIPRSERRQIKKEFAGTHNAATTATPSASIEVEPLPELKFNF